VRWWTFRFLRHVVARTQDVDWCIKKRVSSSLKIQDWSLIVSCNLFSFTYSCTHFTFPKVPFPLPQDHN
jgi:hypothetical protein